MLTFASIPAITMPGLNTHQDPTKSPEISMILELIKTLNSWQQHRRRPFKGDNIVGTRTFFA
jgi:hypothetical protein